MKHLILGSIFSVFLFNVNGQLKISDDFDYTLSKPYEVVDGLKSYFSKNGEVLSVKYGKGVFTFQKFDESNLNETKRNVVEKEASFTPEEFLEYNGRFYFFSSRWDRENVKEQLFVREISFDNANFEGEERLLVKVDGKVTHGFVLSFTPTMNKEGKFNFASSFNEERLIIEYRAKPTEKRDALNKDLIGMFVFNENLEEIWGKEVEMIYTEKKMNNIDYTIDGYGNAYILAEVYKDETTRRKTKEGTPNYNLEVIRIDGEDQTISTSTVDLKDKFITDVGFFEGKKNEIVVAGYYGNKFNQKTDGIFFAKLNKEGEITDKTSAEIPVDVMAMYRSQMIQDNMEKRDEKGKDLSLDNMVLREIVFEDDGSVSLYGEKYYVTSSSSGNTGGMGGIGGIGGISPVAGGTRTPGTSNTSYVTHYEEVLAAKLNADGSVAWMTKLPKKQKSKSTNSPQQGGLGYYLMNTAEYSYILFLDNVKNIELPLDKYPKTHVDGSGGFLTGFKINNESGAVEKVSIFDTRDAKGIKLFQFNTDRIIEIDENTFGVECYIKKKEDVMIKVTMKD